MVLGIPVPIPIKTAPLLAGIGKKKATKLQRLITPMPQWIFFWTVERCVTKGNVEGGFYSQTKGGTETAENTLHLDTAVGTTVENAPTEETYYQITGGSIQESGPIGSITITLQGADSGTEKPSVPSAGEVAATFQVSGSSDRSVSLYTTETENVYRTELLSDYVYLNGSIPITIDGTEYYVGGKINNSYQSIALSTSLSSTNYITMNGLGFYLEVNLNDWTISTVQS